MQIRQLTIEELQTSADRKPTREFETLRAIRLPRPSTDEIPLSKDPVEHDTFTFIAKKFDTPEHGPHLRWTICCEVVV